LLLPELIEISRARTENLLDNYITHSNICSSALQKSMRFSVLNGGKRLRPLLVYAAGMALGATLDKCDLPAAAIELIHSYSLVHDDLPAMDNADLRRGKPTCHKVFGEAMGLLAGDALQTLAFQLLAQHSIVLNTEQRLKMISILSNASGAEGMAGGQALDLQGDIENLADLDRLHRLKTAALLTASIRLGVVAADQEDNAMLETYAADLGLAFQIQDDLLDLEGDEVTLGKPQGIDVINKKITYPRLLGIAKSKQKIAELTHSALTAIQPLGANGNILCELAEYLLHRKY
jgi:farnesyl diphosphate synthase